MHLRKFQKLCNSRYPYGKLARKLDKMSDKKKENLLIEAQKAGDTESVDLLEMILNRRDSDSLVNVEWNQEEEPKSRENEPVKVAKKKEKIEERTK